MHNWQVIAPGDSKFNELFNKFKFTLHYLRYVNRSDTSTSSSLAHLIAQVEEVEPVSMKKK